MVSISTIATETCPNSVNLIYSQEVMKSTGSIFLEYFHQNITEKQAKRDGAI